MGEPAGISSEITLKIWKNYRKKIDPFIYFGDPEHLLNTSKILKLKIPLKVINKVEDAHKIFNNWELAIASYNAGRGNITKSIRRSGGKSNYWSIRPFLPQQTKDYIPALIAAIYFGYNYDF